MGVPLCVCVCVCVCVQVAYVGQLPDDIDGAQHVHPAVNIIVLAHWPALRHPSRCKTDSATATAAAARTRTRTGIFVYWICL